ncbi:MAG TPA: hypothetical protein VJT67_13385, partial [Longimicrobiaceae bacterium]|nr:hypothetical protein [Longimicrobiaceae bacterium]
MSVAGVRWSAEMAALGDEVRLAVELGGAPEDGVAIELEVDACYEAGAAAGGGYVREPVARMQATAAA